MFSAGFERTGGIPVIGNWGKCGAIAFFYKSTTGEDKKALAEIKAIRRRRKEMDKAVDMDLEPEF